MRQLITTTCRSLTNSLRARLSCTRGSNALMIVTALLFFTGGGISIALLMSTYQDMNVGLIMNLKAHTAASAGMELAKYRLDRGYDPLATDYALGSGEIDITTTPATNTVTVVGTALNSTRTYSFTTNFSDDCFDIDTSSGNLTADMLLSLTVETTCFTAAQVTDWTIAWTPDSGERVTEIRINGSNVYTHVTGETSGTKIDTTDVSYASADGTLAINHIEFNQNMAAGKTYTLTAHFIDGSSLSANYVDGP